MIYMENPSWSVPHEENIFNCYLKDINVDWCKIGHYYYTTMATAELSDLQKLELKEAFDEFDKVNFTKIIKLIYEL